jgi:DNA-binding transcriptional MerR regulator
MAAATLRIGDMARRTGLSVRTLRYYDDLGLLVPSGRTTGEHRLYSEQDLRRLLAVQHLTSLGLSLAEVRAALDDPAFDAADALARHVEVVQRRIAADEELLRRLRNVQGGAETGWEDVLALIALITRLEHGEPLVRLRAALDAPTLAPLPVLVQQLVDEDETGVHGILAWAVAQHGPDAVPLLTSHLTDDDPGVRTRMLLVLAKLRDPQVTPALVPLLADADRSVATAAAHALGSIGGAGSLDALVARLGADDDERRTAVSDALAVLGDAAVPAVTARLSSPDRPVREHAAAVLGFIGNAAAGPALATALTDPEPEVRLAALLSLGRLSGGVADTAIAEAVASGDDRLRVVATRLQVSRSPRAAGRTP